MTKTMRTFGTLLVCALLVVVLAGCASQKSYEAYAKKIRVAVAEEKPLTYEQVNKKLGTSVSDLTVSFGSAGKTGLVTWYVGCENQEDVDTKLEKGKSVPYIMVTFSDGKATDAKVGVAEPEEK